MNTNPHIGSSLDSFLEEGGLLESSDSVAKERIQKFLGDVNLANQMTDEEDEFIKEIFQQITMSDIELRPFTEKEMQILKTLYSDKHIRSWRAT